ncbi:hypothetical protein ACUIJN_22330 [Metabacillus halosaccharovorans]|uniref:hypothetical protein n=1 Tax=Metabacillus halosaccharovorans TaxID=930124 RepID=UPI00203BF452|nr:hypothetical protein [Metabacillus halosaccharovorans]MCM3439939.1 hypothetical protein [Metabacillus halosaccharovorans]
MMNENKHIVEKLVMQDHLESFIKCPYQVYYFQLLHEKERMWRQNIQAVINSIVHTYYELRLEDQTKLSALKLINQYWHQVRFDIFRSGEEYYMVLAKITDHLLQFLSTKSKQPPLFLYENLYIKGLESQASITIELAEWSATSFSVKKFLLEADQQLMERYSQLVSVFSYETLGILPEKIEIVSLLDGRITAFYPIEQDIPKGVQYLEFIKQLINENNQGCFECPLTKQCKDIFKDQNVH